MWLLRRRSYLVKLFIFVGIFWLATLYIYNNSTSSTGSLQDKIDALGPRGAILKAAVDKELKDHVDKEETEELEEKKLKQKKKIKEDELEEEKIYDKDEKTEKKDSGDDKEETEEEQHKNDGFIPPPKSLVPDPDSPIYKKGDPNQAGENGKGVKINKTLLSKDELVLFETGFKNNAFNQYASDMISIHRSLPTDIDEECKTAVFEPDLPETSIIMCFHNEAWSVLLRSVHSILDRSPEHLIKEIILVDDFSNMQHLKKQLDDYMSQYPKVKILRLPDRVGLIRARLEGAKIATGKVLTFLDSHIECMERWLEPLLTLIAKNKSTVVCPVIDVIDDEDFTYHYSKAAHTNVGGFDWGLQFNWHPIPARDKVGRKPTDPVRSPTMAGGLFSIDKSYFEYLGAYDPGFDIWGGENLEISFKIWMCGGELLIVSCSHVGHIFRKKSPYKWRTGVNVLKKNSVRLAEVWLDEYKEYYYERINHKLGEFGDISDRIALRKRLNCKSFKWYLTNIFPELFIPGDAIAKGEIRNLANPFDSYSQYCIDCAFKKREKKKPVSLYIRNLATLDDYNMCVDASVGDEVSGEEVKPYRCHLQGGNQYWMLSNTGEIRRDESCIDYDGKQIMIYPCHGSKGNQQWVYSSQLKQLKHFVSKKCLSMKKDTIKLFMAKCDTKDVYQQWRFQNYNHTKAIESGYIKI
ncbi:Putative polypeptide N-acetylgalactosaminyltransferase 9 [Strongyloides ratti]|uniref:Polypeptide N-acetylgalactosaminyltransferase n=1 Tax=Strongyloides ratti TaxID=34506 RepID=A0A090L442_STRRB|nr:Putative polypeptide N-acetylgalactosaminyltransferase 9 [Strongyloides ratti]CEF64581.1 Putative polypeptide N-acetylgalactosaminyltransferase 9 [Strongyloides ratti]